MLIKCRECELQVSDKALSCPHCGLLLKPDIIKIQRKSNKRKRLPNGFGQISQIKNKNLRKQFRALVTVGKSETGRFICKPLKPESYFSTYNEAYEALCTITSAWAYCSSVYSMRACDLRARHIKGCMENGTANIKGIEKSPSAGVKTRIKWMSMQLSILLDIRLRI